MFGKKNDSTPQNKPQEDAIAALTTELRSLKVQMLAQYGALQDLRTELYGRLQTHMENCDSVESLMEKTFNIRDQYAGWTERIGVRVGDLESSHRELHNKIFFHDQTFRALGADLIARASGAQSVAPLSPNPKDGE